MKLISSFVIATILGTVSSASAESLRINGPDRIGAATLKPFIFSIPALGLETNSTPSSAFQFSAKGLPPGLKLNPQTGVIDGTPSNNGTYEVLLTVAQGQQTASRQLEFVVAPTALALTPLLGWNSWYVWGCNIDDAKIRAAADQLVSSGLAAHGYNYINIDDCWQQGRNAAGEMVPKSGFPDMKALADYVHSKGLHLGIYTSPGIATCGNHPGSLNHVDQDVQTYARWGMDLVKYDWCWAEGDEPTVYQQMSAALAKAPRAMVHMICQYGLEDVWKWGASVGGNTWRTNNDLHDTWDSIVLNGFQNADISSYAGPGHWNDLDFLMVGKSNWPIDPNDYTIPTTPPRATRLTLDEQYTHMSIWSLMASPLIISSDLSQLDETTKNLLMNDDVLAIDQDSLGKAATKVGETRNGAQIWTRPLKDGSLAVGLFNLNSAAMNIVTDLNEIGFHETGALIVKDLWKNQMMAMHGASLGGMVPAHGVLLLKISRK
jgi:hypothetical protein